MATKMKTELILISGDSKEELEVVLQGFARYIRVWRAKDCLKPNRTERAALEALENAEVELSTHVDSKWRAFVWHFPAVMAREFDAYKVAMYHTCDGTVEISKCGV